MRIRAVLGTFLVVATLGLAGCSSSSTAQDAPSPQAAVALAAPDSPQRVDAQTFAAAVKTPGVTILDVRTPEEFAAGHIDGAVNYNVEGPDFASQIAALDPAGTYAVYCRSGNRSQVAVTQLSQAGINHIYELQTGINGWTEAGFSTVA
jgi:rhodanese-related sulfurtransferase